MRSFAGIAAVAAIFAGTLVAGLQHVGALEPELLRGPSEDSSAATAGWKLHSLPKAGFSIELPPSWRAVRVGVPERELEWVWRANPELRQFMRREAPSNAKVPFRAVDASADARSAARRERFVTNFNLLRNPSRHSAEEIWADDVNDSRRLPGRVGPLADDKVDLPAGRALRLRYDARLSRPGGGPPVTLSITQYSVVSRGVEYVLTLVTTRRRAALYQRLFERAAESFRLLAPAQ